MNRKRHTAFFIFLFAVYCDAAAPDKATSVFSPGKPKCVFAIEIIADSHEGVRPGTMVGDHIFIYEYASGELTAESREGWNVLGNSPASEDVRWGGGPAFTNRIRMAFKRARLNNFNFDSNLMDAKRRLVIPNVDSLSMLGGVSGKGIMTVDDGRTVRVYADLEGSRFDFRCIGLWANLDWYSKASPELQRLKDIMDAIAYEYGRSKMGPY